MNDDSRLGRKPSQENSQVASAQPDTSCCGGKTWPSHVDEQGAAPTGDPGPGVVVDFDNEIIELVGPAQTVAWFIGRPTERTVVAPIGRILAPGIGAPDPPGWQPRRRAQPAIAAPPQSERVKAAPRGSAITLALVGPDTRAAKRDRHGQRTGEQPALRAPPRPRTDSDDTKQARTIAPVWLSPGFFQSVFQVPLAL